MHSRIRRTPSVWRTLLRLRKQILFAFGILLFFRLLATTPIPLTPVERTALHDLFYTNRYQVLGQILGLLDTFTAGSLQTFSLSALGLYPYIIALAVLKYFYPAASDKAIQIVTVPVALLEAFIICAIFHRVGVLSHFSLSDPRYVMQSITMLFTLTAGTMLLLYCRFLLDEIGILDGFSLLIFAGIASRLPPLLWLSLTTLLARGITGIAAILAFLVVLLVATLLLIYFIRGQRRVVFEIPSRRMVGRGMLVGSPGRAYIPIPVMNSGNLSFISVQCILLTIMLTLQFLTLSSVNGLAQIADWIGRYLVNTNVFWCYLLFFVLAALLTYETSSTTAREVSETMMKQGQFIPGHRPGEATESYLAAFYHRFGVLSALLLGGVSIFSFLIRPGAYEVFSIASLLLIVITVKGLMEWFAGKSALLGYSDTGFLR